MPETYVEQIKKKNRREQIPTTNLQQFYIIQLNRKIYVIVEELQNQGQGCHYLFFQSSKYDGWLL